jgi:hypothetical protein
MMIHPTTFHIDFEAVLEGQQQVLGIISIDAKISEQGSG